MKKKQKQIVIERQILKTLNMTHCTLQTSKVGYLYNVVMVLAYLSFASSAILLRRGNQTLLKRTQDQSNKFSLKRSFLTIKQKAIEKKPELNSQNQHVRHNQHLMYVRLRGWRHLRRDIALSFEISSLHKFVKNGQKHH